MTRSVDHLPQSRILIQAFAVQRGLDELAKIVGPSTCAIRSRRIGRDRRLSCGPATRIVHMTVFVRQTASRDYNSYLRIAPLSMRYRYRGPGDPMPHGPNNSTDFAELRRCGCRPRSGNSPDRQRPGQDFRQFFNVSTPCTPPGSRYLTATTPSASATSIQNRCVVASGLIVDNRQRCYAYSSTREFHQ